MQRRSFLKNLAGAGALVAVSELPSFGTDKAFSKDALFPLRKKHERLSLNCTVINIGLEKPFSVLHITDTHLAEAYPHEKDTKQELTRNRNTTFGGKQEEALVDSLSWAKQNVDYVIHTGDLIDWQSEANFDLVRKYFGTDMTGSMGNHEFSPDMWLSSPEESKTEEYKDLTRKQLQDVFPVDISFASRVVEGVNFITLDDVYGYVTQSQVDLFKKEVEKGFPIVLCMHVPFYSDVLWRTSKKFWDGCNSTFTDASIPEIKGDYKIQKEDRVTAGFIKYLKKEKKLKAILAGHLHFFYEEQFSKYARQYVTGPNFLFSGREIHFV